jgi:hypothetical protein
VVEAADKARQEKRGESEQKNEKWMADDIVHVWLPLVFFPANFSERSGGTYSAESWVLAP